MLDTCCNCKTRHETVAKSDIKPLQNTTWHQLSTLRGSLRHSVSDPTLCSIDPLSETNPRLRDRRRDVECRDGVPGSVGFRIARRVAGGSIVQHRSGCA